MKEEEEVAGQGFEPEDAEAAEITNVEFSAHSYNDILGEMTAQTTGWCPTWGRSRTGTWYPLLDNVANGEFI